MEALESGSVVFECKEGAVGEHEVEGDGGGASQELPADGGEEIAGT